VNDLEKKFLLQLSIGVAMLAVGFYLVLLFTNWCFNWLLEAFQTIINNPLMNLADLDKTPLLIFLYLVVAGLALLIGGIGLLLRPKTQSV
jgi:hypothetical protein